MSNFTLQTVTKEGEVLFEDELLLEDGDFLIMTPPENTTLDIVSQIHHSVAKSLSQESDGIRAITVCPGYRVQVLKKSK